MGIDLEREELTEAVYALDPSNDGKVAVDRFIDICKSVDTEATLPRRRKFRVLDLTCSHCFAVAMKYPERQPDLAIERGFELCDVARRGVITLEVSNADESM